jgi:hypothetical protein
MCFEHKNLVCDIATNKCICKPGFYLKNSTCIQTINERSFNETCLSENECGSGLSCINKTCQCKDSTFWKESKCSLYLHIFKMYSFIVF